MAVVSRRRLLPVLAVSLVGSLAASSGTAWASIPDSSGVIHACYMNLLGTDQPGLLSVIDPSRGGACIPGLESPLSWDQTGPAGATGAAGPAGSGGASAGFASGDGGLVGVQNAGSVVQTLSLPAGEYMVTVAGDLNPGNEMVDEDTCYLADPATTITDQPVGGGAAFIGTMFLQGAATLSSAGQLTVTCAPFVFDDGGTMEDVSIDAVKVGSINGS